MNKKAWPLVRWTIMIASVLCLFTAVIPYVSLSDQYFTYTMPTWEVVYANLFSSELHAAFTSASFVGFLSTYRLISVLLAVYFLLSFASLICVFTPAYEKARRIFLVFAVLMIALSLVSMILLISQANQVPIAGIFMFLFSSVLLFFSTRIQPASSESRPSSNPPDSFAIGLTCLSGEYAGAVFPMDKSMRISMGRDPSVCHLIITGPKISRKHCLVEYSQNDDMYLVTDFSSNGTFTKDGQKLMSGSASMLPHGTIILIGNEDTVFKLN